MLNAHPLDYNNLYCAIYKSFYWAVKMQRCCLIEVTYKILYFFLNIISSVGQHLYTFTIVMFGNYFCSGRLLNYQILASSFTGYTSSKGRLRLREIIY